MNNSITDIDKVYRYFQKNKFDPKKAVPTVSMSIEIELDKLIEEKKKQKRHITIYQFLLYGIAKTIANYPYLYAFNDKEIRINKSLDINIPVSIDQHVEYIIVRDAAKKTLDEIVDDMDCGLLDIKKGNNLLTNDLVIISKLNKLEQIMFKIRNFKNPVYFLNKYYGNLPVTNFGSFNAVNGVAVISQPVVSAIVLGRAYLKPKLISGELKEIENILVTICFDHRVVDGAYSGAFLSELKKNIEEI